MILKKAFFNSDNHEDQFFPEPSCCENTIPVTFEPFTPFSSPYFGCNSNSDTAQNPSVLSNLTGISVGNDWDKEIDESVFQNTDYDTIMLKIYWKTINTAYGVYDWSTLDVNLLNCAKYGKKIIFEIATGNKSPDFIYNAPYNVPKLTFQEFKNASNPVPPLKTFEVPLFTDAAYKTLFEEFLVAFNEHLQAIQYAAPLDVYNLFWRLSVSGVNETTAEFRINSQVELTADGVTSTNATNIWTSAGVGCQEVLDSFKYFYGVITNIFPKQNTAVYFLTGGFPPLAGGLNIQTETVNWIKNEGIENCAFIYTSVNVGANGGSLFSYIKSLGLPYGGEMNSRVYEFCTDEVLDAGLTSAELFGYDVMQIRDDNITFNPLVVHKFKDSFN